jgi:hypothetical protein
MGSISLANPSAYDISRSDKFHKNCGLLQCQRVQQGMAAIGEVVEGC